MKIGTDIVEIHRFYNKLENLRFLNRVYTQAEQAYIQSKGTGRFATAAGLFCAKEAAIKAIGTGFIGKIRLTDLSVSHDHYGAPVLQVIDHPEWHFSLSISHSREYATACVLFWEET